MASANTSARGRGRPHKVSLTADELMLKTKVLNLTDAAFVLSMDVSTVLRKEKAGLLPRRRAMAGRLVFLTAELRAFIEGAPIATGADPDRSRKSREIALARNAGRQ